GTNSTINQRRSPRCSCRKPSTLYPSQPPSWAIQSPSATADPSLLPREQQVCPVGRVPSSPQLGEEPFSCAERTRLSRQYQRGIAECPVAHAAARDPVSKSWSRTSRASSRPHHARTPPGAGFWFVPIAAAIRGVHASCTRCACAFGWISLPNRQAYTC